MELNRKRISREQKFNILSEHQENGTPISGPARLHGNHPITIYQWKRQMSEKPKQDLNVEKLLLELNDLKKKNKKLIKAEVPFPVSLLLLIISEFIIVSAVKQALLGSPPNNKFG